LASALHIW